MADKTMFIAADVGGTKTNIALYDYADGGIVARDVKKFSSSLYDSLEAILDDFLQNTRIQPNSLSACFAVAGPVIQGRAEITKLPWVVDEKTLQQKFSFASVRIVNDLVATAHGIEALAPSDIIEVHKGDEIIAGARAIIAPGTGLGEASMFWDGARYVAYASQGGHCGFAPVNVLQIELLKQLMEKHPAVSYDMLCCGSGIRLLYEFFSSQQATEEFDTVAAQLAQADDWAPVITQAALAPSPSPRCLETVELFCDILAQECANLALKVMALGGVYLGGGISPKVLPLLKKRFTAAFETKGPMNELLGRIPVSLINNPEAALLGAANLCLPRYQNERQ